MFTGDRTLPDGVSWDDVKGRYRRRYTDAADFHPMSLEQDLDALVLAQSSWMRVASGAALGRMLRFVEAEVGFTEVGQLDHHGA